MSGSWRHIATGLEEDIRRQVSAVLERGDGIVTGGALGVDYLVTELVRQFDPELKQLKIFLPTDLDTYLAHFRQRVTEKVITARQAKKLDQQLRNVQKTRPRALFEGPPGLTVNEAAYYARNRQVVNAADELLAFQVNASPGTQHTIDYAHRLSKNVAVFKYKTTKA